MFVMHPEEVRSHVAELVGLGVNDCEIARLTGVPRETVRDQRHAIRDGGTLSREICLRCWRPSPPMAFTAADYAELLGLYLGDGYIVEAGRTFRLRLFLDAKYERIVDEARDLLERCFFGNRVGRASALGSTMAVLSVYGSHLPCLFPQHGVGPKHLRTIALERWQQDLVEQAPWELLKGLIRSDGCSFVNRTGPYEYTSFCFANRSEGIVNLFVETCGLVGIQPRATYFAGRGIWHVRINRRTCVSQMLEQVGLKE